MKKLLLFCFFLGIIQSVFSQKNNTNNLPKLNIKTFEEGKIIFKLKKNAFGYEQLNEKTIRNFALKAPQKCFPKSVAPHADARSKDGQPLIDLTRIFELEISLNISLDNAVKALLQDPAVEYAEKIRFHQPLYVPNDPSISPATPTEHLNKVRAYQAWDTQKGSATMIMGIVDFGFTTTHPDMQANLHPAYFDFGNNDTDLTLPHPYGYHGGTVSGLAAATPDNAIGVAGVGFDCRYLPIKFVSDDLNTQKPEESIEYAMNNGAKIINMSWGREGSTSGGASQYEEDFYNYCVINRDVVLVAAAGNTGVEQDWYPATYKNVVSVGGTAQNDDVLSTYGRGLDILAPFNGFYTIYLSSYNGGLNGTSFSSPIVSAGAALVRAQFPTLTAFQVRARLESTADNVILGYTPANVATYQGKMGYGRLNIERALTDINVKNVRSSNHQTQNNGYILAGTTTTITADFKNYLTPTTALQATLTCFDSNITITDGNSILGAMATNTSKSNILDNFSIQVSPTTPTNLVCVFKIAYTDGTYTDFDYFTLLVNPDFYLVNSSRISIPINKKGAFEYNYPFAKSLDCPEKQFTPLANNIGFVVATSATKVSNTIAKYDGTKDADFVNQSNFIETNSASYQEVKVGFNDNNASANDIGVDVAQKSYVFKNSPNNKFIISEYLVKNTNATTLNDVYVGLFTDFDIKLGALDKADYDATNKMSYVFAATGTPNTYAGVKILTTQTANSFAIDGNTATGGSINLYDGFTKAEKFQALTSTRLQAGGTLGNDVSIMLSAKINALNSNASQMVAFALLFGDNLADLQAQAVLAQTQFNAQNTTADAVIAPNFNVCTGGNVTLTPTPPVVSNPALIYDFYVGLPSPTNLPVFSGLSYTLNNQTVNQTYYVVARDNNLFASAPKMLTINILNCTTANPVITSNFNVCTGGSVTLTPTPPVVPNPALIYDFYVGLPSPTNLPVFSGLSYTLNNQTVNQTYYVVARDANAFASAPTMVTITLLPASNATFTQSTQEVILSNSSVTFTDTTPNANISSWRISDGRTLVGRSITLNFSYSSTFTVILTSTNTLGCISKLVFGTVVVRDAVTSLNNSFSSAIKIYPNPAQEYIFIENLTLNAQKYTIIDVLGREVLRGDFAPNNVANNKQIINMQNLPKGIYYLQSIDNKVIINSVFVKN